MRSTSSALRRLAARARYVTSVCTGSLLLGAAGLLTGRRAACHWAFRELLPLFGAIPDPGRVVRDGKLFTGGGVTAGIDMALAVAAHIGGAAFRAAAATRHRVRARSAVSAAAVPRGAPAAIVAQVRARFERVWPERLAAAQRAAAALAHERAPPAAASG